MHLLPHIFGSEILGWGQVCLPTVTLGAAHQFLQYTVVAIRSVAN